MKILKFGGSSIKDTASQQRTMRIIQQHASTPGIVIVSAFGGVTDQLIALAHTASKGDDAYLHQLKALESHHHTLATAITKSSDTISQLLEAHFKQLSQTLQGIFLLRELTDKMLAQVMSYGELLSATILSHAMNATFCDTRQLIITNDFPLKAQVDFTKTNAAIQEFASTLSGLAIATGFIAQSVQGHTTTLGRSGSDYTAAIFGAALHASVVMIWTDVSGVMTADPRRVPDARVLDQISYQEAMEMSHFGATVIHPATMTPLIEHQIPIQICNTFEPDHPGTLVQGTVDQTDRIICGLSSQDDVALLTVEGPGMQGVTGIVGRLFQALAQANINIILISQASSEQSICFVVLSEDATRAKKVADDTFSLEIAAQYVAPISIDHDVSIIAVVGEQMKQRIGIAGKLFDALARVRVNIIAIAQGASELNISIVVSTKDETIALRALHESYFEKKQRLQLFLFGATGLVGRTLCQQLAALSHPTIECQLFGLCNSTHQVVSDSVLAFTDPMHLLEQGIPSSMTGFVDAIIAKNQMPNRVFIDCSASNDIANYYATLLNAGVSVVTPNKKASAGPLTRYRDIMSAMEKTETPYHYEVTVGAALPIINSIKSLVATGDRLQKIEAVLSGSLNYIFSEFDEDQPFSQIVKQAQQLGFTEPDPRDDLNGMDVARKLVILLRQWGYPIELSDLPIESLVPLDCTDIQHIDDFYSHLATHDTTFKDKAILAAQQNEVLRYVATYEDGQARVGLESYNSSHPFFRLDGSNNMLILTTDRYAQAPLIIEGPGAGAEVTAAGVLADILLTARRPS